MFKYTITLIKNMLFWLNWIKTMWAAEILSQEKSQMILTYISKLKAVDSNYFGVHFHFHFLLDSFLSLFYF